MKNAIDLQFDDPEELDEYDYGDDEDEAYLNEGKKKEEDQDLDGPKGFFEDEEVDVDEDTESFDESDDDDVF